VTDGPYVLTLRQPWASAVFLARGGKNVENRTWKTNYRGRLYIHAAGREDIYAPHWVWDLVGGRGTLPLSAIIGYVTITACQYDSGVNNRWAHPNMWHWFFTSPALLTEAIPATGGRALWPLPGNINWKETS